MEKSAFWNINDVKNTKNVNSNGLGRVKNENVFSQTTLDKRL